MMEFNTNIHFLKEDFVNFHKNNFKDAKDIFRVFSMLGKLVFKTMPDLKSQVKHSEKLMGELLATLIGIPCNHNEEQNEEQNKDQYNEQNKNLNKNQKMDLIDIDTYEYVSILEKDYFANKEYIKSVFSAFPKVDTKKMIAFMINYSTLVAYLNFLCCYKDIKDKRILHQLYLALLEAVDPSRKTSNYFKYFPDGLYNLQNTEKDYVKYLVDSCRNQIKKIPSYGKVKEFIKKYVFMKKDYLIYKQLHNHDDTQFLNWSENYNYKKYYPELFPWEFQAAAYSDLVLYALLAAAFDPYLEMETIINIDKAYFPWINGLQVLLKNYVNLYQNIYTDGQNIYTDEYNFSNCYDNLRQCEERLVFFYNQSLKVCSELKLNNNYMHRAIIKLTLAFYLSDPRAHIGLKKVASRNILASAGTFNLRFWKTIMSIIMPLILATKYQY